LDNNRELKDGIDQIVGRMVTIADLRKENSDIIKDLAKKYDLKPSSIRKVASILLSGKMEDASTEREEVKKLTNMVCS